MGKQPSSVDLLPDDVREQLQELLRDRRLTQLDATRRINELLEAMGHPDRLSKSAVNRYAVRMEEVGQRLRQSREVAEMWIGKLGSAPGGQVGNLVNEMVRSMAFELSLKLQETELDGEAMPETVNLLKGLSLTMQRLEAASTMNVRREAEIRKQAADKAEAAIEEAGKASGGVLTVDEIRAQIRKSYGIDA